MLIDGVYDDITKSPPQPFGVGSFWSKRRREYGYGATFVEFICPPFWIHRLLRETSLPEYFIGKHGRPDFSDFYINIQTRSTTGFLIFVISCLIVMSYNLEPKNGKYPKSYLIMKGVFIGIVGFAASTIALGITLTSILHLRYKGYETYTANYLMYKWYKELKAGQSA